MYVYACRGLGVVDTALGPRQPRWRPPHSSCRRFCLRHVSVLSAQPLSLTAAPLRPPPSSQFSPFLCEFFSHPLSFSLSPILFSLSLFRLAFSFLFSLFLSFMCSPSPLLPLLVTLSQSIQPDLPSHPSVLHPRNAFQPPLTPPPRCNLPLSPGPLPPSIPSAAPLLHRGTTLTPPATAQTPPNRATPGLIKEQRGSGAREGR